MRMTKVAFTVALALAFLAGCNPANMKSSGALDRPPEKADLGEVDSNLSAEQIAAATAITQAPSPKPSARATAAQLDTTTAEQKQAAAQAPAAGETRLGTTVASLGNPSEGGFWIKTPLVKSRGIGRIRNPANGKSARVDLIPLEGPESGGSQVSLPALQLIGVSLTDLPEIEVFRS